jgi:arylsulfatase A-like enzyme
MPGDVSSVQVLLIAAWSGAVLGLIEAARIISHHYADKSPVGSFYPEVLWVAPLANAATLVLIALLLIPVALVLWPRRAGLRIVPPVLAIIGLYALIRQVGGIYPLASIALAIGLTTAVLRLLRTDSARMLRMIRRTVVGLAATLVVYAFGLMSLQRVREWRALRAVSSDGGEYNVLLLILDTVRAMDLSVYGYDRPTTPNLERLARRGAVFESAWTTAPWTLPSHASIFTGRSGDQLSADYTVPLDTAYPTLAEEMTSHGYATGGFVANYYFAGRPSGLARGFIHYEDFPIRPDFISTSTWLPRRIHTYWDLIRSDSRRLVTKTATDVNREFLDWLPTVGDRPFFAFLNYLDAHDPFAAPEHFTRQWAKPGTRYSYGFHNRYSAKELQELRAHYNASIAYIDAQIGELLQEMDRRGLLEKTLVVITSDHGEQFGEHDPALVRHGWSLYSPALHVPLIMVMPGVVPEGVRVGEPVSIANIAATILDIVVPEPVEDIPGESLARFWALSGLLASGDEILSKATVNPSELAPSSTPIRRGPMTSIVSGNFHYIRNGDGVEELYDISVDRWEQRNLATSPEHRTVLSVLRARLSPVPPGRSRTSKP